MQADKEEEPQEGETALLTVSLDVLMSPRTDDTGAGSQAKNDYRPYAVPLLSWVSGFS